jgi:hypothetical protein
MGVMSPMMSPEPTMSAPEAMMGAEPVMSVKPMMGALWCGECTSTAPVDAGAEPSGRRSSSSLAAFCRPRMGTLSLYFQGAGPCLRQNLSRLALALAFGPIPTSQICIRG